MARLPRPHTLLLAIYPALFLYSRNIVELAPSLVIGPLLITLAAATALDLILRLSLRDALRSGLIVSLLLLLFFSYGHVYEWMGAGTWLRHRYLLPLWLGLTAAALFLALRARGSLFHWDRALSLFAATATAATAISLLVGLASTPPEDRIPPLELPAATTTESAAGRSLPDIYYIVLDAYAGDPNLRDLYGYDNGPFLGQLASHGLRVAHHSRSNYATTLSSSAATLNMEYLDRLTDEVGSPTKRPDAFYSLIRNNRVERILQQRGYACVRINTPPAMFHRDFTYMLLRTTVLAYWEDAEHYRKETLDVFRRLYELKPSGKPTFVYAHIVCPHAPYVFGPRGERPSIAGADRLKLDGLALQKLGYLGQLRFVNWRVDSLVRIILSRSTRSPIIIVQSDHGPRNTGRMDRPDATLLRERLGILNAYRLPAGGDAGLYDSISPVNSFRLIFRNYFGLSYKLLPDRSYFSLPDRPLQFVEVPAPRAVGDSTATRGIQETPAPATGPATAAGD